MSEPAVRNRVEPFFNRFIEKGYNVKLVCADDDENRSLVREEVEVFEVLVPDTKIGSFIKRALYEIKSSRLVLKKASLVKADTVLVVIPSMFLAFLSPFYMHGKNKYLDVCDLSWEYLDDKRTTHFISKRIFRAWFKLVINSFKGVIVTNPTEEKHVKEIRRDISTVKVVPNGITQSQFDKLQSEAVRPDSSKIKITYVGNVGLAQHLDTFVEAAKQLPDVEFIIVGGGTDFERIHRIVEELGLNNLVMTGRIPWERVKNYYDSTDILYAQLTPDYATAVPSKLYEYLATGKYVIYGGMAQAAERMNEFEHNQVIEPCSSNALVKAISFSIKEGYIKSLSEKNIEMINRHYIRENTAEVLIDMVESGIVE